MIVKWGRLSDEIMRCVFDWVMVDEDRDCPFMYMETNNIDFHVPKGVPTDCELLCHKWFTINDCPCNVHTSKNVRASAKKLLKERGWVE